MKEKFLGYLAAFTLGIVCMGTITLVFLRTRLQPVPASQPAPVPDKAAPSRPEQTETPPRRQTFQRLPRPTYVPVQAPAPEETKENAAASSAPAPDEREIVAVPVVTTRVIEHHSPPGDAGIVENLREGGRLSGKVRLLSEPPAEKPLPIADQFCTSKIRHLGLPLTTRFYVRGVDRGLADVVVSLRLSDTNWGAPRKSHLIQEDACLLMPYVSAIQAGQTVLVRNLETTLHNVRLSSEFNGEVNRRLLRRDSIEFPLNHAEDFVRLKCEVHPWEFAYISVFDHPFFAVTDKNGQFVIEGIPPGRYTLDARHRKAGTISKEVTIEMRHNTDVRLAFEIPPTETAGLQ